MTSSAKRISIEVHPQGNHCRVEVDGAAVHARSAVIRMDVGEPTRIELECLQPTTGIYRVEGYLVSEEDARLLAELKRQTL